MDGDGDSGGRRHGADDRGPDLGSVDVALAHWGMRSFGGAETVVDEMAAALGVDRVYTVGDPGSEVRARFDAELYDLLEDRRLPALRRLQARADRVFGYALWEDVDWRPHGPPDVLLTSGSTTRAVIAPDPTLHLNYCHSPPRWLYDRYHDRIADLELPASALARPALRYLRTRDAAVDGRVDGYLANSPVIARRLWKFYGRDADVVYPPVDVEAFDPGGIGGFYLHVGRLDREKGVHEVVEAFAGPNLDADLVLIGPEGDDAERVLAAVERARNVDYRGYVSVEEKRRLYERARAVLFNGAAEDFGIVPVEALAAGTAALVRGDGFPAMLVDDVGGLEHDGTVAGIRTAVERFERDPFGVDPGRAGRFSRERFVDRLRSVVIERRRAFEERFRA